jgi:hypothetical protein
VDWCLRNDATPSLRDWIAAVVIIVVFLVVLFNDFIIIFGFFPGYSIICAELQYVGTGGRISVVFLFAYRVVG